jgi:hypothetical protein
MREAGFKTPISSEDKEKLEELNFLEKSVGQTGRLAMAPFLRHSSRDLWQVFLQTS